MKFISLLCCLSFIFLVTDSNTIIEESFFSDYKTNGVNGVYPLNSQDLKKSSFLINYAEAEKQFIEKRKISKKLYKKISKLSKNTEEEEALFFLVKGDYLFGLNEYVFKDYLEAYENAYRLGKKIKNKDIVSKALYRICNHYFNTQKNTVKLKEYSRRYINASHNEVEAFYGQYFLAGVKMQEAFIKDEDFDLKDLSKVIFRAKKINKPMIMGQMHQLYGSYHFTFNNDLDSTLYHFTKAQKQYKLLDTPYAISKSRSIEINKSIILQRKKEFKKSISKLDSLLRNDKLNLRQKLSVNQFLKEGYVQIGDYRKAFASQESEKLLQDSLSIRKQDTEMAEIRAKYDISEKEKEVLIEKQRKNRIQNIAIVLGTFIVFGGIIAYLNIRNTKKKQLLAEQGKTLQEQKVTTLLKEQELVIIDAMISGQEKERLRIANDLHDNLGALMSTVKLHFNAIEKNNGKKAANKKLFIKTNQLLDDAYKKIREMAHAKNSGVIAKDGLLAGVKRMARTISASDQLKVSVFHFGLENRLENSLELALFRIVQELTTNIIKHANAKEANIHLTNHDNMLNIMVEDDGKGFNTDNLTLKKDGMGLKSIDHRIEKLNGKMQIESKENKGTTIIIDIPV